MKKYVNACLLIVFLTACRAQSEQNTLTVFAASSLTDAFDALAEAYEEANPDVEIIRNYAASSQLAIQLVEGAQADIFASANERQMQVVVDAGRIIEPPQTFATNRLVIITPVENPARITTPQDLAQANLRLLLAAPETPIRDYSDTAISRLGDESFQAAVYANLVSEETNVRQVSAKIALGEADAGIVYTSDVTPDIVATVQQIAIPDDQNVIAHYPLGIISDAPNQQHAATFINFVLSPEGQAILAEWGFGSATGS
jgi:molybdate transport system substrate-binding protein